MQAGEYINFNKPNSSLQLKMQWQHNRISYWAKTAPHMNVSTKDSGNQLLTLIQAIQETKQSYKNSEEIAEM